LISNIFGNIIGVVQQDPVSPQQSNKKKTAEENSPRKRKLCMKIKKLKAQNKSLRETVRRLRMEKKKQTRKAMVKEEAEYETLRNLGCKLLSKNFAKLLSAQIDKQIKSKRGIRYDPNFKKFALSLYFSSPQNYRKLKESIALPSVRSLQLYLQTRGILHPA